MYQDVQSSIQGRSAFTNQLEALTAGPPQTSRYASHEDESFRIGYNLGFSELVDLVFTSLQTLFHSPLLAYAVITREYL